MQGMAAMAAEGTWKAYFRGNGAARVAECVCSKIISLIIPKPRIYRACLLRTLWQHHQRLQCIAPGQRVSHRNAIPAGANVVKNVPETAIKMGFNDRIKALVVKDGHPITLGAAFSSLLPMPS